MQQEEEVSTVYLPLLGGIRVLSSSRPNTAGSEGRVDGSEGRVDGSLGR